MVAGRSSRTTTGRTSQIKDATTNASNGTLSMLIALKQHHAAESKFQFSGVVSCQFTGPPRPLCLRSRAQMSTTQSNDFFVCRFASEKHHKLSMLAMCAFSSCTASIDTAAIANCGPHVNAHQFTYNWWQQIAIEKNSGNAEVMRVRKYRRQAQAVFSVDTIET